MATIKVTPMIGQMTRERLDSLRGCHAISERAVVKGCTSETLGKALTEAIQEIILAEAKDRHAFRADEVQVIVTFRL